MGCKRCERPHYRRSPEFVYRKIAAETVLVPVGKRFQSQRGLYRMNETAGALWLLLERHGCLTELLDALLEDYDAPRKNLEENVNDMLKQLISMGAVEAVE